MLYIIFIVAYLDRFFYDLSFFDGRRGWRAIILWPKAEGVFPHDEVRFISRKDLDGKRVITLSESYSYTYQGRSYTSRKIVPERLFASTPRIKRMNKMLTAKRGFRVYVNPDNSRDAYISPGYARKDWNEILLFPVAVFLVPLGAVIINQQYISNASMLETFTNLLFLNPWLHLYFAILFLITAIVINWTPKYGKRIFPVLGTRDIGEGQPRPASEYYGPEMVLKNLEVEKTNLHYEHLPANLS